MVIIPRAFVLYYRPKFSHIVRPWSLSIFYSNYSIHTKYLKMDVHIFSIAIIWIVIFEWYL